MKVKQPPPLVQLEFKMADRTVAVRHLGRLPYGKAMAIMKDIVAKKLASVGTKTICEPLDTLLLVEHNPVYTIGTRSHVYLGPSSNELGNIDVRLKRLGAEFCVANRGGLITFHGPGQLVCYPILNLRHYKPSVKWYINSLEEAIIETCNEFNLNVGRTNDIGVWIDERKIAAIGVHVTRYITSHGLALNCNMDLKWFDHIVPCGIKGKSVTSLSKELQTNIEIKDVVPVLLEKFRELFNCKLVDRTKDY